MAYDEHLIERVREGLTDVAAGLTEKCMFGGTTFLLNGNMLCCVSRAGLMVRVGAEGEADGLQSPFAKPCLGAGRRMAGFLIVDFGGLGSKAALSAWLGRARRYVETLPHKMPKPGRSARETSARKERRAPSIGRLS